MFYRISKDGKIQDVECDPGEIDPETVVHVSAETREQFEKRCGQEKTGTFSYIGPNGKISK